MSVADESGGSGLLSRALARLGRHLLAPHASHIRALRAEIDELRTMTQRLSSKLEEVASAQKQVAKVLANQKNDDKHRHIFRQQLGSLLRAQYLATSIPAPFALQARRFRLRSQNEEDGIVLALLEAVGVRTRRFVEIGSGGTGGNSAVLAHDLGWSGLMVDASKQAVRVARHELRPNPGVQVVQAMVTPSSIDGLLREHGFDGEVDVLSIDVDSVDYWLLSALTVCSARVLVVEYNAHFGPTRAVTLPNAPRPPDAPPEYFGASLAALDKAATAKGYRLVLCEFSGVNAFFVRRELAPELATLGPQDAYRPFRHRLREGEKSRTPEGTFELLSRAGLPLVDV